MFSRIIRKIWLEFYNNKYKDYIVLKKFSLTLTSFKRILIEVAASFSIHQLVSTDEK